jgi:hypothetical protein
VPRANLFNQFSGLRQIGVARHGKFDFSHGSVVCGQLSQQRTLALVVISTFIEAVSPNQL